MRKILLLLIAIFICSYSYATVVPVSAIDSSIIPKDDNTKTLGTSAKRWNTVYSYTTDAVSIDADSAAITTVVSSAVLSTNVAASTITANNVGVGSASPTQAIDVVGQVKATSFSGDGSALTGVVGGSSSLVGLHTGALTVASGSTTVIDSAIYNIGGNVGINSTVPNATLVVKSTGKRGIRITTAASTESDPMIYMSDTSRGAMNAIINSVGNGDSTNGLHIATITNALPIMFSINNTRAVTIDGTRNVGIGVSEPRQLLDVDGAVYMKGNVGIGTTVPLSLVDINRKLNVLAAGNVGVGTWVPSSLIEVGVQKFNVTSDGNVGIGSTIPQAGLVIGNGGTPTYPAIASSNDAYIRGDVEIDGNLYVDSLIYPVGGIRLPHLQQSDTTDQAIVDPAAAQVITFNSDDHHFLINRTSSSRFTALRTGSYMIAFSGIATGAINETIDVWLRVNGSDVAGSNTKYTFKSNSANTVIAVTFIQHLEANQYFEFWTAGSAVTSKWDYFAAGTSPTRPVTPSIIITANYIGSD